MTTRVIGETPYTEQRDRWQGMCADCVLGDHVVCDGYHAWVGDYDGPMPRCTCGCAITPWPWPHA